MHRAWDLLLWALLLAVALATGLAIGAVVPGSAEIASDAEPIVRGRAVPLGLVMMVFAVAGLVVSLESSERGRLPRLALATRLAILVGGASGALALAVGASRTSPLAHVALLAGAFAACGTLRILLDRVPLDRSWMRVLRRLAMALAWIGVLLPAALVVCLGVATWCAAMVARGEPPLADEGALPLAEFMARSAALVWAMLVVPLALVVVAGRMLGPRRLAASATPALAVAITCPRCGDRRPRPFGQAWACGPCGLIARADAPDMSCECGTSLVGVSGERCPGCDAAIRTRWGGPTAEVVELGERASPSTGIAAIGSSTDPAHGSTEARQGWRLAGWLLLLAVPPLVLLGTPPIGVVRMHLTRLDTATIRWAIIAVIWTCLLVALHACVRGKRIWLAVPVLCCAVCVALVSAPASDLVLSEDRAGSALTLVWSLALLGTGALALLRLRTEGGMETRARGVSLVLLAIVAALVAASAWQSSSMELARLARAGAILILGLGLALVLIRRLARRRHLRPDSFRLPHASVVAMSCPRCTALLKVPLAHGRTRCGGCDLSVHVELREGDAQVAALPQVGRGEAASGGGRTAGAATSV